ncbi:MAG: protoglobin domain-containing protein [Pseudonocardia sp.]|nr:protoglobin domain-containing protein [Pseudonocardia sp.]
MTTTTPPAGYSFDDASPPPSPVGLEDLERLKASVLFGEDDAAALAMAGDVLADQVTDVLDTWYGFVGSHPHLVAYFAGPDGEPVQAYLDAVYQRFGRWILDTCRRPYDERWLAYQHEIGLRHTTEKKNRTDGVDAAPVVPLRYLIAFIFPITATMRPFLERKGHPAADVDRMYAAWCKSVTMQVALWARPYAVQDW